MFSLITLFKSSRIDLLILACSANPSVTILANLSKLLVTAFKLLVTAFKLLVTASKLLAKVSTLSESLAKVILLVLPGFLSPPLPGPPLDLTFSTVTCLPINFLSILVSVILHLADLFLYYILLLPTQISSIEI